MSSTHREEKGKEKVWTKVSSKEANWLGDDPNCKIDHFPAWCLIFQLPVYILIFSATLCEPMWKRLNPTWKNLIFYPSFFFFPENTDRIQVVFVADISALSMGQPHQSIKDNKQDEKHHMFVHIILHALATIIK